MHNECSGVGYGGVVAGAKLLIVDNRDGRIKNCKNLVRRGPSEWSGDA